MDVPFSATSLSEPVQMMILSGTEDFRKERGPDYRSSWRVFAEHSNGRCRKSER